MPKIISLSPVDLNRDDLPADIAALLDDFTAVKDDANRLHGELSRTPMHDASYGKLNEAYEAALVDLQAAHAALSDATRRSPRQIQDACAGSFGAHVERARALLVEAEAEMRAAAVAAGMFATAKGRAGQPILAPRENVVRQYGPRVRSMSAVSGIRNLVSRLPEDVDD